MFKLKSENLSGLGSMGSSTTTNWIKYFNSLPNAKAYAVKNYKGDEKIKWSGLARTHSQDLGYVMYEISKITVEDENDDENFSY